MQGDVIAIVDSNSNTVARYTYDAWGVCTVTQDVGGIATINPFRYRGYYYDEEIGMYYLQSRYYDAGVGRFINADDLRFLGFGGTVVSYNIFAYCKNNLVCWVDGSGTFGALIVGGIILLYLDNNLIHSIWNQSKAPSGYIYNQNDPEIATLKFGFFNSDYNGCGWIATYNALIMLGKKPQAQSIISEYELTGAVLFGVFGIQPYAITHYFRFRKYNVTVTYKLDKFDAVAKKNTANIIWFWHKNGAHYVALHWKDETFVGYNTYSNSVGSDNWGTSISKKVKSEGWKATLLISISN